MWKKWACVLLVSWGSTAWCTDPFNEGYAGSWSNPPGALADFYFTGPEHASAELTVYDVNHQPRANVSASISSQRISNTEPWEDGYGFQPSSVQVPNLPSGMYFIDGPEYSENRIPFIISDPSEMADIVVVYPTNTVNAYARTRGINLYSLRPTYLTRPPAVSFHRPQLNSKVTSTRPFDRWLIDQQSSYKYISDADLEDFKAISGAKLVLIPGHSEYWTATARKNFDRFVELGGSALVLSGNTMFRSVGYDDPQAPTQLTFSPRIQFTSVRAGYPTWESIGADYAHGGIGSTLNRPINRIETPYFGWKMLDVSPSYLSDTGLEVGDILFNPSAEYDGVPHVYVDPITGPVVDHDRLGFFELDVIAFENTTDGADRATAGTWIDFLKTEDSGRVINVGSAHWTPFNGPPDNAALKKQITGNMIDLLLIVQADFDGDEQLTTKDIDLLTSQMAGASHRMRFDLTEDELVNTDDLDRWLFDFANTTYADANLDGKVDFADFTSLVASFGETAGWAEGDFNGDQLVDFEDFVILTNHYRADRVNTTSSVPEPSAKHLLGLGGFALAIRFWTRASRANIRVRHTPVRHAMV